MEVVNPNNGNPMVAQPAAPVREIVKAMVGRGSSAAYATNFAERVHEKERELGVLYVDPVTRYTMRVKKSDSKKKSEDKA